MTHTAHTPPDRVVWVIHRPTTDRRTGKPISLDMVRELGTPRIVLQRSESAESYADAAREMWEAFNEFEDGDVVCSMGGDLHSMTMVDDMLRQRGVAYYYWGKHLGYGKYETFLKDLTHTHFAAMFDGNTPPHHTTSDT